MTKEILDEYIFLKQEIIGLEKRIEKIKSQSPTVADVVQNGYKGRAVIRGYDLKRVEKIHLFEQKLQERHDMCVDLQIKIEEFIKNIPKTELRQIFEYKYYNGMNWIQIAFLMNTKYNTEKYNDENLKKKHDRYLKKFQ